jgi:hypothetical protein
MARSPHSPSLREAAQSVNAAWDELAETRKEESRDDDQARRYIAALWRVQTAENDYLQLRDELRGT